MFRCVAGKGDLVGSDVDEHLRNGGDTVVKSSCDVKALTYCDLKSIFIPGLMDVLKMYLEYQQEFANDIKHDLTYNLREGYDSEQQDMEIGSAKNILPSISEDDEERGSEEEDKSPVRSALQLLQSISHNIGGIDNEGGEVEHGSCYTVASNDGRRLTCGNVAATTGASGGSGSNSYMQENRLAPMCRSSPSVFAATYRESRGSSTLGRHRTRNVSTQTDLPINVPVAVLEAFVLAHRSRVLQLLGVPDVPDESCESPSATQPQASSPAASEQGATESEETSTSSSENLTSSSEQDHSLHGPRSPPGKNSVQNQKPSITIQPAAASLGGETRNNNNNRTPNAPPLEMYQLTNLRNWNPTPRLNKSFISSSRSTGSLRDILSNNVKNQTRQSPSQESGACPALVHNQVPKSETDADKTLVHYTCASNCPKTDLICFSEVNHTMTRSTSMPVSAFKIQPNPSSSPSASSHPHSSRAPAAPIPQSPPAQTTTREIQNKKPTYVTDF
ncbi:Potassium voltage-gated channel subfamily H member 8 [Portunus trituberculatus]|uniref:Potassium voltage-gated channel subfamily H member 8 n=1 Tax=Portunus trituberculatus TaxID=210409 RepID=A0A5B7DWN6_PORTR|nr:Potassium voltage-gated channel subfamily H member 8 [Portunus trituberculatus]